MPHGLTLSWPQATDDVSVVHHHVFQDGMKIGTLDGQATSLDVSGLSPWTDYDFTVRAEDQAGNMSEADLGLTVKTTDEVAPSWGVGELVASDVTPYALTLTWPVATDDVGIAAYSVAMDGVKLINLGEDVTSLEVVDLSPWTDYVFSVTASDAAGNWSVDEPYLSVKTTDTIKPTWPEEAELVASNIGATSMTLTWPEASDDVGVESYAVFADGAKVAEVTGDVTEANLTSLTSTHFHLMELKAIDPAGNVSSGLTLSVETLDNIAPTWPGDAALTSSVGMTDLYLSWPAAADNVGVTSYRVFQDGEQIAEGPELTVHVQELKVETTFMFKVEAGDAVGNWSSDGPSATVKTARDFDPGFRRLTKEQFMRSLADLIGSVWEPACDKYQDDGCGWSRDAEAWYERISNNGTADWREFSYAYPKDVHTAAPGEPHGGYMRLDPVVYNEHVTSWVSAIMYIADYDFEGWVGAVLIFNACQNDGLTQEQCIDQFITDFGKRAFRRPLTEIEHALFTSVYVDAEEEYKDVVFTHWSGLGWKARGLRDVIAAISLSPQFLYRVELGDENGKLTAWELASRLSYHFWNTMPDDALFAAAEDGSLLTEEGYKTQVDRLATDSKAKRSMEEFYRDFFRVQDIADIMLQDGPWTKVLYQTGPNYEAGADARLQPSQGKGGWIQWSMQRELINLGTWFTAKSPGTYEEMFRSNLHFLECHFRPIDNLDICLGAGPWSQTTYGIDGTCVDYDDCAEKLWKLTENGWDGVSEPITLPEKERAGLLTRMGLLAANTHTARPIQRGLKIREILLCDPIPPPEDCDVVKPPNLTGMCEGEAGSTGQSCSDDQHCEAGETCANWDKEVTMTVREKVEELTETPGTSCAGCHTTFINGFGHALGHFSSVGKYWETEHMFTTQKDGYGDFWWFMATPDQWKPIDVSGTTIFNGKQISFDGPHEVADILVDSGQMEWCWSREYFRFAMGRIEWEVDATSIDELAQSMRDGATLADAYKAIVYLPQFKTLYKPPKAQPKGDTP
jgi:chitodextrinase